MATQYTFQLSYELDHESIMQRWAWFRKQLIHFYQVTHLPEFFNDTMGEISENTAIYDEDSIEYHWTPAEFNYNWRSQDVSFDKDHHKVAARINIDDYSSYYWFSYESTQTKVRVKFYISPKEQSIEIKDEVALEEAWVDACANLVLNNS